MYNKLVHLLPSYAYHVPHTCDGCDAAPAPVEVRACRDNRQVDR